MREEKEIENGEEVDERKEEKEERKG